ncbi:MAG: YjbQ family protein [Candidatus Scalindua sp.]|nr:YjbQ family protein [Candidatus Scalindua sp.]
MIKQLTIKTSKRNEFVDITAQIQEIVGEVSEGVVTVFVPHTTTGITINENADPDVPRDILKKLEKLIPQRDNYSHMEGNSDAHIKASLFGSSVRVIIQNGQLLLGTWQSIFFCEFDGPRTRMFYIQV